MQNLTERRIYLMAKVMIIEFGTMEETILQELSAFFSKRKHCQVTQIPLQHADNDSISMCFPGLSIHLKEQTVYQNGLPLALSRFEFLTLCYLAKHPGWVFSKEQIYEAVWNEAGEHCGTAVTNVIIQLRRKMKQENPNSGYIRTVIGRGYKFNPD